MAVNRVTLRASASNLDAVSGSASRSQSPRVAISSSAALGLASLWATKGVNTVNAAAVAIRLMVRNINLRRE